MKRWFCGFSSTIDDSLAKFPRPQKGERLWGEKNSFWLCGNWEKQQIIKLTDGGVQLAIVGTCLAAYETIVELFQNAVRNQDYSRLMRLPGSYNVIVQDRADTYVFADIASLRPVFYTVYDACVIYSSLGVALQQLTKAEVDRVWLATYLTSVTRPYLQEMRSPFYNVQTVPAGHYLHISGGKATCKRYWYQPQDNKSLAEGAEQLREQLLAAVEGRVRLYGNITSDMSGGFDSTTLALIAAKSLEKQNQKLPTITLKTGSNADSQDLKCAQHAASLYPNIAPVVIDEHELPPDYSNLDSVPLIDTPETATLCIGTISHTMGIIKSKGSRLHMNGEGGDAVLSAPPTYMVDLLRNVQIRTFLHHVYGWSRVQRSSPIPLLKNLIGLNFSSYRHFLVELAQKLKAGQLSSDLLRNVSSASSMGWDNEPELVNWYTKDVADSVAEELQEWLKVAAPFADSVGQHQAISIIQFNGFCTKALQQVAEYYDVNVEFPYLDSLVIDACLSTRLGERTTPFKFKPLLSKAFEHDLPPSVFTRTTKGDYTSDEFVGLRQNLPVINELFQTSLLADMGLIDVRQFRAAIKQFSMGIVNNGFTAFSQTMATELWLRKLVNAGNTYWENTSYTDSLPEAELQTLSY